ncbi:type VI secretion system PAAR protein [Shewanella sp. NFH-SH190041]|uniref:type VI secretion system PAAR protein n=1 Tax=Shewanella sp. NFH-SH190041 TaxID=2950245 RepID=UPI0021C4782B|nr:type VI secretion system PAAR protein [Shewanella sp. NFH-SH190041]
MAKAIKLGDIDTGHEGFPPTPVITASSTVICEGRPMARKGDMLLPHTLPPAPPHPRSIKDGSTSVFIDGKPAARSGDGVSCGGTLIGAGTVNIG